ncbi:PREDICTED: SH3 domain-binding glutamic acid-rich-like protein [Nipponia nippon]|uniref:SH3 domain-binding glutamic acid-rich-like protein n=1 Tax=Nipponia nippon TaxID=128390 RepID=UPI000510FD72|nr:PREDICTED: SH3 domain-binding glutamic acid-rich-like protein [Nipponia nippon]
MSARGAGLRARKTIPLCGWKSFSVLDRYVATPRHTLVQEGATIQNALVSFVRLASKLVAELDSWAKQIKKQQQDVLGFLEANKIEFEEKDIAANEENRKWMRENVPEDSRPASGNPLPPRLFNDSRYLGDYEAFFEARENNAVYAFLGLTAPPGSKEAEALAKQQA